MFHCSRRSPLSPATEPIPATFADVDKAGNAGLSETMRKGLLARLRNTRRWLIHAVALMLMLPALMGLLPQPALSASAALARDLQASVCGRDLPQQQGGGQHDQAHEHCMLCTSHCASCSPSHARQMPAFAAAPRRSALASIEAAHLRPLPLQALLDASPPRGPPARA